MNNINSKGKTPPPVLPKPADYNSKPNSRFVKGGARRIDATNQVPNQLREQADFQQLKLNTLLKIKERLEDQLKWNRLMFGPDNKMANKENNRLENELKKLNNDINSLLATKNNQK